MGWDGESRIWTPRRTGRQNTTRPAASYLPPGEGPDFPRPGVGEGIPIGASQVLTAVQPLRPPISPGPFACESTHATSAPHPRRIPSPGGPPARRDTPIEACQRFEASMHDRAGLRDRWVMLMRSSWLTCTVPMFRVALAGSFEAIGWIDVRSLDRLVSPQ